MKTGVFPHVGFKPLPMSTPQTFAGVKTLGLKPQKMLISIGTTEVVL
jgi:hypothetical protein